MNTTKIERTEHANALIKIISQHGRRFFWNEKAQRVASLELDGRGRVWFIDEYRGARIYTHKTTFGNEWRGFSHGGTLRSLVEDMRDYITTGKPISRWKIVIRQLGRKDLEENIWGYSVEAGKAVREAAYKLPIIEERLD